MVNRIFISYSKKDSPFAHKLADDLAAAGFEVWIDRSIGGGEEWRASIMKNLKAANKVVVVVSPHSLESEWVRHEGSLAYGWKKKLYPILIAPIDSLPPWMEEYQYIDFVAASYTEALATLVRTLTPTNPLIVYRKSIAIALIAMLLILAAIDPTRNLWLRYQARKLGGLAEIPPSTQIPLGEASIQDADVALLPAGLYDVPGFYIERAEVTVERYQLCLDAGACQNDHWDAGADPQKPARNISARQASQFCRWIGRRLPTAYEWERAARYTDGRPWPWDGLLPPETDPDRYRYANLDYELDGPREDGLLPIGSTDLGQSKEGVFDLIGNVWEWSCTPPETDPGLCQQDLTGMPDEQLPNFAIHGGSLEDNRFSLESSAVHQYTSTVSDYFGFRCAEDR